MFISFSPGQSMGENGEHPRVVIPRSSSQGKPVDQTSISLKSVFVSLKISIIT